MPRKMKPHLVRRCTTERIAFLRNAWNTYKDPLIILAELNAMPGEPIKNLPMLRMIAHKYYMKRPFGYYVIARCRAVLKHVPEERREPEIRSLIRKVCREKRLTPSATRVTRFEQHRRYLTKVPEPKAPRPVIEKAKITKRWLSMGALPELRTFEGRPKPGGRKKREKRVLSPAQLENAKRLHLHSPSGKFKRAAAEEVTPS